MTTEHKASPTVRLNSKNLESLTPMVSLGLGCAELINEILERHLKRQVETRIEELRLKLAKSEAPGRA